MQNLEGKRNRGESLNAEKHANLSTADISGKIWDNEMWLLPTVSGVITEIDNFGSCVLIVVKVHSQAKCLYQKRKH